MEYYNEQMADARDTMMTTVEDCKNYELRDMLVTSAQKYDNISHVGDTANPAERKKAFDRRAAARAAEMHD